MWLGDRLTLSELDRAEDHCEKPPLYLPLIENRLIRLANLLPGAVDDGIQIHLFIVQLGAHIPFEALSYLWGDASDTLPVVCNGHHILVTRSLHSALKRLRHRDKVRTLWADAICINQADTKERSHHVAFMHLVYETAETVLAYIGQDPDGRAHEVASIVQEHKHCSFGYASLGHIPVLNPADPVLADPRWKSVSTLLKQLWFSRAWVIQEVGLGKRVIAVYGQVEFDYRDFIRLLQ